MQALILTGGFGTRMRPLTYTVPKPLLPIVDRPMVEHILDRLPREVNKVVLASNYKIDRIEEYFAGCDHPFEVLVVDEPEPRGTGGAIRNAEEHIDEEFFVFNGDIITSLDLTDLAAFHRERGGIGTLAAWEVEDPTAFGIMDIGDDGRIRRFKEKPGPEEVFSRWINAGTYLLEPEIMDHIPPARKVSIEREVFPNVLDKGLNGFPFTGYWVDCGKPHQFLDANRLVLTNVLKGGVITSPDARVDLSADLVPPLWLGQGSSVGPGSKVGPYSIVGTGCSVGEGCTLEDSVMMPGSSLGPNSQVKGSILGGDVEVGSGCEVGYGELLDDNTVMRPDQRQPPVEE